MSADIKTGKIFIFGLLRNGARIVHGVDRNDGALKLLDAQAAEIIKSPIILYIKDKSFSAEDMKSYLISGDDDFYALDQRRGDGYVRIITRILDGSECCKFVYVSVDHLSFFLDEFDRPMKPSEELKKFFRRLTSTLKEGSEKISVGGNNLWVKGHIVEFVNSNGINLSRLVWPKAGFRLARRIWC